MKFEAVRKWWNKNSTFVFCVAIGFGFLNYIYFCTHHVLSPDALHEGQVHIAGQWEASLGRWGLQFIDRLRGGLVSEWLIVTISILLLALVCVLVVKLFKIKKKVPAVLLSALIMLAPQFAESAMFIYCFDSYCLAMLLAVLAVYLVRDRSGRFIKIRWGIAFLCIVALCSLYQAYLGVALGLVLAQFIFDLIKSEKIQQKVVLKEFLLRVVLIIAAVITYYALTKVILKITGVQLASYKGANNSIWTIVSSAGSSILTAYSDFIRTFFTSSRVVCNIMNYILMAMILLTAIITLKTREVSRLILIGIAILLMPLFVNVMDIIAPGTTINWITGAGMTVFYMLAMALCDLVPNKLLYCAGSLAAVMLSRAFLLGNLNSFYAREDVYNNFYTVSSDILTRAYSIKDYKKGMKFCYNDIIRYESQFTKSSNKFMARDNETWDNFDGMRDNTANFYKRYLGVRVDFCTKDEYKRAVYSAVFKDMPSYPAEGSIKIIDGMVVVKFNDNVFKL
ncbi:glucosyltransferase domain-containing protein [Candidatus Saccharibacteria bacterium]|nr:glucosyltransferase domain-containing protein [Candidatus Saccharibacteria bacterium]